MKIKSKIDLFKISPENMVLALLCLVAIIYPIFTAIGVYQNYTEVPFGDSWAILEMDDGFVKGNYFSTLFNQHNEHRIFISRILFAADLYLFGGKFIFLLVLNCLLPFLSLFCFWRYVDANSSESSKKSRLVVKVFILAFLFLWVQKENFTWEFQSQFFLAQIFPLIFFFLLYKSAEVSNKSRSFFVGACLLGILSVGTMANGVLALPLGVLLAFALRMSWQKIAVLVALSAVELFGYFYNFQSPSHHGSLAKTIVEDPIGLLHYTFSYLGNPIRSKKLVAIFGFLVVFFSAFFALKIVKNWKNRSNLELSLLCFLLYIGASAFVTAGGRVMPFGIEQAFSSRYTTPALMAWIALIILAFKRYENFLSKKTINLAVIALLVLISFIGSSQRRAIRTNHEIKFPRTMAVVAIELGINDFQQTSKVYHWKDYFLNPRVSRWKEENLAIFGHDLVRDVSKIIGTKDGKTMPEKFCAGSADKLLKIEDENNYLAIEGWIFDQSKKLLQQKIFVLDANGEVIGYGLSAQNRKDVKATPHKEEAKNSVFKIYILSNRANGKVTLRAENPDCKMIIDVDALKDNMSKEITKF